MYPPSQIQAGLLSGQQYYSKGVDDIVEASKGGCVRDCDCCDDVSKLSGLVYALNFRISNGIYDEISDKLYDKIMQIVGQDITKLETVSWTYTDFDPKPIIESGGDIDYLFTKDILKQDQSFGLNFTSESNNKYWVVRFTNNFTGLPVSWESTTWNKGTIPDLIVFDDYIYSGDYVYTITKHKNNYLEEGKEVITFNK